MENQHNQPSFSNMLPSSLPNATAVLVLGIISIPTCFCYGIVGLACGIIALYLAAKDKKLYLESPSSYTPSSYNNLKAGRTCAIIGVSLSGLYLTIIIIYIILVGSFILPGLQEALRQMRH